MKNKLINLILILILLNGCVGASSKGVFGTGVSVALDPRTVGTQIDDGIMDKNLDAKLLLMNKNYLLSVSTQVLDGRIFITGKVDDPEEKLKITKLAWEIEGTRSVKNDLKIKEYIFVHDDASRGFEIPIKELEHVAGTEGIKIIRNDITENLFHFGMVLEEAKQILDVEDVISSILLVEDLRIQKN